MVTAEPTLALTGEMSSGSLEGFINSRGMMVLLDWGALAVSFSCLLCDLWFLASDIGPRRALGRGIGGARLGFEVELLQDRINGWILFAVFQGLIGQRREGVA